MRGQRVDEEASNGDGKDIEGNGHGLKGDGEVL